MVGALILVAVKGSHDIGGAGVVLKSAWETNRIEGPEYVYIQAKILLNTIFVHSNSLSFNPTVRHTLWSQLIGGVFYWTQTNAVSQNMIQRYLALPTLRAARLALFIFCSGVLVMMALCGYNGLLIYATYKNCDPLTTKVRDNALH